MTTIPSLSSWPRQAGASTKANGSLSLSSYLPQVRIGRILFILFAFPTPPHSPSPRLLRSCPAGIVPAEGSATVRVDFIPTRFASATARYRVEVSQARNLSPSLFLACLRIFSLSHASLPFRAIVTRLCAYSGGTDRGLLCVWGDGAWAMHGAGAVRVRALRMHDHRSRTAGCHQVCFFRTLSRPSPLPLTCSAITWQTGRESEPKAAEVALHRWSAVSEA